MHVLIGDQKVDLTEGAGGRLQATFTATENTSSVLIPSDCIGTLNVNDIQLEQGSQATSFVEPAVHSEDISGIFKDLRDIRIDIKDTEEGLSHQITINQEGLEQLISDTEEQLNSRITLTADTWQGELDDAKRGLNNQITATANLWQTKLSDTERGLRSVIQTKADSLIALVEDTEKGLSNQITATASLWQTKLSDTERGLQSAIQSKADSLITLIEDTDSKNFSKTEQLVNGLQTTVQGNLKSQRTQLENLISSSIESATGSRSTIWQTLNSHGSQISNAQGAINRVEQTVSGYSRRISNVEGNYSSIEQTVNGLNTEVNGYYGGVKSRFRQLEGLIDARVTRKDVEGIIQNSGDNIWLAIGNRVESVADNATMSGYEIMSEINLQANRQIFRVSDNRLMITEDTTYISNATIKNSHIASLNADKITAGTLDAGKVRVINLDANNITANRTSFIQSSWNSLESSIRIDSRGLLSTASNGSQVYLQNGIVGTRNPQGATIGQIGYAYITPSPWYSIQTAYGAHFQIRMSRGAGDVNKQAFYIMSGGKETYLNTDNIYLQPSSEGRVRVEGNMIVDRDLRVESRLLLRSELGFLNGGYIESQSATSNMLINASNDLVIYTKGSNALEIDGTHVVFKRQVSENSDARLKTNIIDMPIDSLEAIRNLEIKKFDFIDGRTDQYGIIAQEAQNYLPELIDVDSEGYLMVNKSAMTYINMHAIKQLDSKVDVVDDEVARLKAQIASLQDELALLKGA